MRIREQIKKLVANQEAAIFGKLYSLFDEKAQKELDSAIQQADAEFKKSMQDWVVSAKEALGSAKLPEKNLSIKSDSYLKTLAYPFDKIGFYDLEMRLYFVKEKLDEKIKAGYKWVNYLDENQANIEKIKLILFIDAVVPVLDEVVREMFSEENKFESAAQLSSALSLQGDSVDTVKLKASKVQTSLLADLANYIHLEDSVEFFGFGKQFFEKYIEFSKSMDEFFREMEIQDAVPAKVDCYAFNWISKANATREELENCMTLEMY